MNRSYSKIRHIQESNLMLESRKLKEKSRHLLMEGSENGQLPIIVNVPIKMDTNNKEYFDSTSSVKVKIEDFMTNKVLNLDEFKSIASIKFGETQILTGRALGNNQYQFITSDKNLQNYLIGNMGKQYNLSEESGVVISMNMSNGEVKPLRCMVKFVKNIIPPTQK